MAGPLTVLTMAALAAAPHVTLITVGEGPMIYERFGHAALRVTDGPDDLVYNFGTTNFDRPDLIQAFLRGHVKFWVSVVSWERTRAFYEHEDRTLWLQDLGLDPRAQAWLAARLAWQARPENRMYDYDHFTDNCTTRVRDLIDEAVHGAARAQLSGTFDRTYRQLALEGFSGMRGMQIATDLLLGRAVDRPITKWDAGFLPRFLRSLLPQVRLPSGTPLAASPRLLYARQGSPLEVAPAQGRWLLAIIALLLLAFAAAAIVTGSRPLRSSLRIGWAVASGGGGAALLGLAAYSTLPLLRENPSLLLFWPIDALLLRPPSFRFAWGYGGMRLGSLVLVLALFHPPAALVAVAMGGTVAALGPALGVAWKRPVTRA